MGRKRNKPVPAGACIFCKSDSDDPIMFGKFIHKDDISIHEKCLFFSSGLKQTKSEDEDIFGFTVADIKRELNRGLKLRCVYCKNNRATVGCSKHECRRSFHYPCGMNNDGLFQHYDSFKAFCKDHKPRQKKITPPANEFVCRICFLSLQDEDPNKYLYTTCCKNNWFHRTCLQEYAYNAGSYFFKCPLCNDSDRFSKEMLYQGIHVPIKDASWELEDNAYQDLLYRPGCESSACKCEQGVTFSGNGLWKLLTCDLCGSQARHKFCAGLKADSTSWTCKDCQSLVSACQEPDQSIEARVQSVTLEDPISPVKIEPSLYPSSSSLKPITNILSSSNETTFFHTMLPKEITADNNTKGVAKIFTRKTVREKERKGINVRNKGSAHTQPKKTKPTHTQPVKKSTTRVRPKGFWKNDGKCCSPDSPYRCIRVLFGLECRRICIHL